METSRTIQLSNSSYMTINSQPTRQRSISGCGSYEAQEYTKKRPPENQSCTVNLKIQKMWQDFLGDKSEQQPVHNNNSDVQARDISLPSSQQNVLEVRSSSQRLDGTECDYYSGDEDLFQSQSTAASDYEIDLTTSRADVNGTNRVKWSQLSVSHEEISKEYAAFEKQRERNRKIAKYYREKKKMRMNELEQSESQVSKEDAAREKQRENNRKYARSSRERKNRRMNELEQDKFLLKNIIEIYTKALTIYHKRLTKGDAPAWKEYKIQWWSHNAAGHESCQPVNCLLPILDDTFLEEIGNGLLGKIVTADSSIMQKHEEHVRPEQKYHQVPASPEASDAFLDDDLKTHTHRNLSCDKEEISHSGVVSNHMLTQTSVANILREKVTSTSSVANSGASYSDESSKGYDPSVTNNDYGNRYGNSLAVSCPENVQKFEVTEDSTTSCDPLQYNPDLSHYTGLQDNPKQIVNNYDHLSSTTFELILPRGSVSKNIFSVMPTFRNAKVSEQQADLPNGSVVWTRIASQYSTPMDAPHDLIKPDHSLQQQKMERSPSNFSDQETSDSEDSIESLQSSLPVA